MIRRQCRNATASCRSLQAQRHFTTDPVHPSAVMHNRISAALFRILRRKEQAWTGDPVT